MKGTMKKVLALLLTVVMLLSTLPMATFAIVLEDMVAEEPVSVEEKETAAPMIVRSSDRDEEEPVLEEEQAELLAESAVVESLPGTVIDPSGYTMTAGCYHNSNGPETTADGNLNTSWHTGNGNAWTGGTDVNNRWIQIALAADAWVDSFYYLAKTANSNDANGFVVQYRVDASSNGTDWVTMSTGEWNGTNGCYLDYGTNNSVRGTGKYQIARFTRPIKARYFRLWGLTTTGAAGSNQHMSALEVRVAAPAGESYTVSGTVKNRAGAAVEGVTVKMGGISAISDENGAFTFAENVPAGNYVATAAKDTLSGRSEIAVSGNITNALVVVGVPQTLPSGGFDGGKNYQYDVGYDGSAYSNPMNNYSYQASHANDTTWGRDLGVYTESTKVIATSPSYVLAWGDRPPFAAVDGYVGDGRQWNSFYKNSLNSNAGATGSNNGGGNHFGVSESGITSSASGDAHDYQEPYAQGKLPHLDLEITAAGGGAQWLDGYRYQGKNGDGSVLQFAIDARNGSDGQWVRVATGSFGETQNWQGVIFDRPIYADQVRLWGITTKQSSGMMQAGEVRLVKAADADTLGDGFTYAGTVTDDSDNGIEGVKITVDGQSAVTDASGVFSIPHIFQGTHTVTFTKEGYFGKTVQQEFSADVTGQTVKLFKQYVTVTVNDGTNPITGATVVLQDSTYSDTGITLTRVGETNEYKADITTTELDPSGSYHIRVSADGKAPKLVDVTLARPNDVNTMTEDEVTNAGTVSLTALAGSTITLNASDMTASARSRVTQNDNAVNVDFSDGSNASAAANSLVYFNNLWAVDGSLEFDATRTGSVNHWGVAIRRHTGGYVFVGETGTPGSWQVVSADGTATPGATNTVRFHVGQTRHVKVTFSDTNATMTVDGVTVANLAIPADAVAGQVGFAHSSSGNHNPAFTLSNVRFTRSDAEKTISIGAHENGAIAVTSVNGVAVTPGSYPYTVHVGDTVRFTATTDVDGYTLEHAYVKKTGDVEVNHTHPNQEDGHDVIGLGEFVMPNDNVTISADFTNLPATINAPTAPTVRAGYGQILVDWTAPLAANAAGYDELRYKVEVSTDTEQDGEETWVAAENAAFTEVEGATALTGTSYSFVAPDNDDCDHYAFRITAYFASKDTIISAPSASTCNQWKMGMEGFFRNATLYYDLTMHSADSVSPNFTGTAVEMSSELLGRVNNLKRGTMLWVAKSTANDPTGDSDSVAGNTVEGAAKRAVISLTKTGDANSLIFFGKGLRNRGFYEFSWGAGSNDYFRSNTDASSDPAEKQNYLNDSKWHAVAYMEGNGSISASYDGVRSNRAPYTGAQIKEPHNFMNTIEADKLLIGDNWQGEIGWVLITDEVITQDQAEEITAPLAVTLKNKTGENTSDDNHHFAADFQTSYPFGSIVTPKAAPGWTLESWSVAKKGTYQTAREIDTTVNGGKSFVMPFDEVTLTGTFTRDTTVNVPLYDTVTLDFSAEEKTAIVADLANNEYVAVVDSDETTITFIGLKPTAGVTAGSFTFVVTGAANEQAVSLGVGESVGVAVPAGTSVLHNTNSDAVNAVVMGGTVTGFTVTDGAKGNLGTTASYDGSSVSMTQALWKFTGNTSEGFDIQSLYNSGVWLNYASTNNSGSGYPGNSNKAAVKTSVVASSTANAFCLVQNSSYLYFHRTSDPRFDRYTGANGTNTDMLLYRPALPGEASSAEIPGYVQVTKLADVAEGVYLVVMKNGSTYYALYPSTSNSNKYSHVIKVNDQTTGETENLGDFTSAGSLSFIGAAAGTAKVVAGGKLYTVTVLAPNNVTIADIPSNFHTTVAVSDGVTSVIQGRQVTLTVTTSGNESVMRGGLKVVKDSDDEEVEVSSVDGTHWAFTMPDEDVTVSVILQRDAGNDYYLVDEIEDGGVYMIIGEGHAESHSYEENSAYRRVLFTNAAGNGWEKYGYNAGRGTVYLHDVAKTHLTYSPWSSHNLAGKDNRTAIQWELHKVLTGGQWDGETWTVKSVYFDNTYLGLNSSNNFMPLTGEQTVTITRKAETNRYYISSGDRYLGINSDNAWETSAVAEGATPGQVLELSFCELAPVTYSQVVSMELDKSEADVTMGKTLTLKATPSPAEYPTATAATISWSSSEEEVATVANGVVTPVAASDTPVTITATCNGITATCEVTVKAARTVTFTGDHFAVAQVKVGEDEIEATSAKVYTVADGSTVKFTLTPDEDYSLTVKVNEAEEALEADANGVYTIENVTANTTVNVTATQETVDVTSVTVAIANGSESADATIYTNDADDDSLTLEATVEPDNATNKTVTWTVTQGDDVISVANGVVTPLKAGTAKVKAAAGGVDSEEYTVTVKTKLLGTASITGTAQYDSQLTADITNLSPAAAQSATLSYQWQANTGNEGAYENIEGATNATYTVGAGLVDKTIQVVISAEGYEGSVTSAATAAVVKKPTDVTLSASTDSLTYAGGTVTFTLTGSAAADATVTCTQGGATPTESEGVWSVELPAATTTANATYKFKAAYTGTANVADAESDEVTVTVAGLGTITATAPENKSETYTGNAISGNTVAVTTPADATVEYSTDGGTNWSTDVPSTTNVGTVTYKWRVTRDGYLPKNSEVDVTLTVTEATLTGTVTVSGDKETGATLTATPAEFPVGVVLKYQWQANTGDQGAYANIEDATGATYTVDASLKGKSVKVIVSTDNANYTGTVESGVYGPLKTPVTAAEITGGTGTVGAPKFEDTLGVTVTPTGADVSYQWQSDASGDFANITGATSATYAVTADDVGHTLRVVVTGTGDYTGTVTSAATATVEAKTMEVSAEGYTGTFDNASHGITVTVTAPEDATVEYSTDSGADKTYSTTRPTIVNVADSGLVVYYKVTKDGYTTVTGSATVTITAKTVTGTAVIKTDGEVNQTPKIGDVLTADISVDAGSFDYSWTVGGDKKTEFDNKNYTVVVGDLDKTITLTVTAKGNYTGTVSSTTNAVIKKPGDAAPTLTIDYENELLSGATTQMEWNDSAADYATDWTAVTGTALKDVFGWDGSAKTVYVRVKATADTNASAVTTQVIPARPVLSGLTTEAATDLLGKGGKIRGFDNTLSYLYWVKDTDPSTVGDQAGTPLTVAGDTEITVSKPDTYMVQLGAVAGSSFASAPVEVAVAAFEGVKETKPVLTIDYENGLVEGFVAGQNYTIDIDNAGSPAPYAPTAANVSVDDIPAAWLGHSIVAVLKSSDSAHKLDSDPSESVAVPARATAPDLTADVEVTLAASAGANGTMKMAATLEWYNGTTWVAGTGEAVDVPGGVTYKVRTKGVADTSFPSTTIDVLVGVQGAVNLTIASGMDKTHGEISVSPASAVAGTEVTLTIKHDAGYVASGLTFDPAVSDVTFQAGKHTYTFNMPASDTEISATFAKDNVTLAAAVANSTHGTVSLTDGTNAITTAQIGDTVTVVAAPAAGHKLKSLKYSYKVPTSRDADPGSDSGTQIETPITLTENVNEYTFTMPGVKYQETLTVTAEFEAINYSITYDLAGGSANNPDSYTADSEPITLVNPTRTGYDFAGWTAEGLVISDSKNVTIPTGTTGNITFTATWTIKSYDVDFSGTNVTSNVADDQKVNHHAALTVTLTADDGYNLPASVTITMGGNPLATTSYTYTAGTITIPADVITGAIAITAAGVLKSYNVAYNLTNLNKTGPENVNHGAALTVTLTADAGYSVPGSVTITVNGTDFTDFTYESGVITIAAGKINGEVSITAAGSQVNKTALTGKIADAKAAYNGVPVAAGDAEVKKGVNYVTAAELKELTDAIAAAEAVAGNAAATQAAVDAQVTALNTAIGTFNTAKGTHTGTKVTVTVVPTEATIVVGATQQLTATTDPTGENVTWESGDTAVATVDANTGLVTAVKAGTATITAKTATNHTATAEITVNMATMTALKAAIDAATAAKADVATDTAANNVAKGTQWVTEAEMTALTDELSAAQALDDSDTATQAQVDAAEAALTAATNTFTGNKKQGAKVTVAITTSKPASVVAGQSITLTAVTTPAGEDVTWSSGDTDKATVNASTGEVTGVAEGSATITVTTASGHTDTVTVNVASSAVPAIAITVTSASDKFSGDASPYTLTLSTEDISVTLVATLAPEGTCTETVNWASNNENVVTVVGGVVTVVGEGTTTITATASTTTAVTATINVTVSAPVVPVNKAALETAITNAPAAPTGEAVKPAGTTPADVDEGTDYWLEADVTAYTTALAAAQGVAADNDATQAQVDQAVTDLAAAVTALNDAKKTGTKTGGTTPTVNKAALTSAIAAAPAAPTGEAVKPDGTNVADVDEGTEYWLQADVTNYTTALAAAQTVADDPDATQAQVDQAVTDLAAAITALNDAKKTGTKPTPVNKTALTEALAAAPAVPTGDAVKPAGTTPDTVTKGAVYYLQADVDAYSTAKAAAQAVADKADATQTQVNDAVTALASAVSALNAAKKTGTYDAAKTLDDAIKAAKTNMNGTAVSADGADVYTNKKWVSQDAKDALTAAIEAAEVVKNNSGATEAEQTAAIANLKTAVETFEAAKAAGTKPVPTSSGSSSAPKPVVTENEDGSKTTTVTDRKTGTVTATTEKPDGTVEVVETKKDGTVTSTTTKPDGTVETEETKPDGTVIETVTEPEGTYTKTVTEPDGAITETVLDADGTTVEKATDAEGDVTITVTDAEGEEVAKVEVPAEITGKDSDDNKFVDVPDNHWAADAINGMAAMELVKGVNVEKKLYDPNAPMTRGALTTVLFRFSNGAEGKTNVFEDVHSEDWYKDSVAWATSVGVVKGYDEKTFAPEDSITRQQLAVMLYRYAKLLGMKSVKRVDAGALNAFSDKDSVGSWADEALTWAVSAGLINGRGNRKLAPTDNATRAEVATVLDRFINLVK